ncbi:Uncharacterised protein [Actinobacillus pleuropneumoniae]|nr:Uncharacterised protein [Actinobacillus pleuropneumoniae]
MLDIRGLKSKGTGPKKQKNHNAGSFALWFGFGYFTNLS